MLCKNWLNRMSHNFTIKRFQNKDKMMSVFFKMAGVDAEYFKVILNSSAGTQKYAR